MFRDKLTLNWHAFSLSYHFCLARHLRIWLAIFVWSQKVPAVGSACSQFVQS